MVEEKLKIPSASVGLKNPESLLALRVWKCGFAQGSK